MGSLNLSACTVLLIRDCRRHTTLHTILTVCQVHVLIALEHRNSTFIFAEPEGEATNLDA